MALDWVLIEGSDTRWNLVRPSWNHWNQIWNREIIFIKEKSEIRDQSTIYKISVKSRKCLHTTSANSDIFATYSCHVTLHECSREDMWNPLVEEWSLTWGFTERFHTSSREHSCTLTWQVNVAKISELVLVVCKHLRDFTIRVISMKSPEIRVISMKSNDFEISYRIFWSVGPLGFDSKASIMTENFPHFKLIWWIAYFYFSWFYHSNIFKRRHDLYASRTIIWKSTRTTSRVHNSVH